jgi:hypothetical protein
MMRALFNKNRSAATLAAVAIAMLVMVGDSRVAVGDDSSEEDARLQKYTVELKEHSVADTRKAATSEIGKAEALRDKARTLMKKRKDRDELARTLDELEATVALIGGKIVHAEAKAKHDEVKGNLDNVRTELDKVQTEAEQLEKKLGGDK